MIYTGENNSGKTDNGEQMHRPGKSRGQSLWTITERTWPDHRNKTTTWRINETQGKTIRHPNRVVTNTGVVDDGKIQEVAEGRWGRSFRTKTENTWHEKTNTRNTWWEQGNTKRTEANPAKSVQQLAH